MSKRNRTAGISWELEVIKDIIPYYPEAISSRAESRKKDGQGIDICNIPWHIQCKNTASKVDYPGLLSSIPAEQTPVVIHKFTRKKNKNFVMAGKYAILRYEDFLTIIEKLLACKQ